MGEISRLEDATGGKPFGECSREELLEACRWFWIARDQAREEAAELRQALQPFAEIPLDTAQNLADGIMVETYVQAGHVKQARSALKPERDHG